MKKRSLLAVFAALTLGVCALGMAACGNTDKDSGSSGTSGSSGSSGTSGTSGTSGSSGSGSSGGDETWSGQVTKAEWEEILSLQGFENFTAEMEGVMGDGETAAGSRTKYEFDGNKQHGFVYSAGELLSEMYFEATGESETAGMLEGTMYQKGSDGGWIKSDGMMPAYGSIDMVLSLFDFEDFTFEDGSYVSTETVDITAATSSPSSVNKTKVTFAADGGFVFTTSGTMQMEQGRPDLTASITLSVTVSAVGTTQVTLPVVEEA